MKILFVILLLYWQNTAIGQINYRQVSELYADSIIRKSVKAPNTKKYKEVILDKYTFQGERVVFKTKWNGTLSKYSCVLSVYNNIDLLTYQCRDRSDNAKQWDEENHIDFAGMTFIVNKTKRHVPLAKTFKDYSKLEEKQGANHDVMIYCIIANKVNNKSISPILLIENVKILK